MVDVVVRVSLASMFYWELICPGISSCLSKREKNLKIEKEDMRLIYEDPSFGSYSVRLNTIPLLLTSSHESLNSVTKAYS